MKGKKIFKAVMTVGAIAGTVFGAYKFGEFNGEAKERAKHSFTDEDEDEFDIEDDDDDDSEDYYKKRCDELEKDRDYWKKSSDEWREISNEWQNWTKEETEHSAELQAQFDILKDENLGLSDDNFDLKVENESLKSKVTDLENKLEQGEFYGKAFSKGDYLKALVAIYTHQKANRKFLIDELRISQDSAKELLLYLEQKELVSTPAGGGYVRQIFFDKNFVKNEWAIYGIFLDDNLQIKEDKTEFVYEQTKEKVKDTSDETIYAVRKDGEKCVL